MTRRLPLWIWIISFGASTILADGPYWPQFRGPHGNGVAASDAPLKWSDTQNVKWQVEIPGRGNSSPIVWGDRVFVTTAIPTGPAPARADEARGGRFRDTGPQPEHRFVLLCLDRKTGKVLWERTARTARPHEGFHHRYGSFASNSPVTDGEHVYAFFGSRGIYCYNLDGKLVWEKDFGVPMRIRNAFGEGTAPELHGNMLILNFDHEGASFIAALDNTTGKELWRTARDEQSAWAPPVVVEHEGRKQVITSATNKVRSYALNTGELIWECAGLGSNVIPAPVHLDGIVYVMSGHRSPNLMAIRLGRSGDLTGSDAVLWSNTRGNSYTPSPVLHEDKLYVLSDRGLISCFNARTGEPYYHQQRLPQPYTFKASPVAAGGKLYLASEEGDVIVVRLGEKYEVLATNTMKDQMFIATPAVVDGEMILRSTTKLLCVSDKR